MTPEPPRTAAVRHSSRATRWAISVGAITMVVIGFVLLYLLMQATNNREMYEANYARLFAINVVVASLLFFAIVWVGYRLLVRLREGKFGSRLLVKLATIFALVGFAPGLLIYVVSYQFVSRSIETWFDVKVEGALEAGLNLGRVTLDTLSNDLIGKSRSAASQISENPDTTTGLLLDRLVDQLGAADLTVWGASGKLIASAGQSRLQLSPDKPSTSQFRSARSDRVLSWVEGLEDIVPGAVANARIKVLMPISSTALGLTADARFLLVSKALPPNLVANALAVETKSGHWVDKASSACTLER